MDYTFQIFCDLLLLVLITAMTAGPQLEPFKISSCRSGGHSRRHPRSHQAFAIAHVCLERRRGDCRGASDEGGQGRCVAWTQCHWCHGIGALEWCDGENGAVAVVKMWSSCRLL